MNPIEVVVVLVVCVLGPVVVLFLVNRKPPAAAPVDAVELPEVLEAPEERAERRLLFAVRELHRRGYERLRIRAGMAPSGMSWRCELVAPTGERRPMYTSGMQRQYFGWEDAESDDGSALADKVEQRFPALVASARGTDAAYARWYVQLLAKTVGDVPVSYWDDVDGSGCYWRPWSAHDRLPDPPG